MVAEEEVEIHNSLLFGLMAEGKMQPLYTEAELKAAKARQPLPLRCLHCDGIFYCPKNLILAALQGYHSTRCFCSRKCQAYHRYPPIEVTCKQCSKPFKKQPKEIKKSKHNFCSQSCGAKYHNAHKTKGTRVSKLERWLQEQLPLLFPSLEFHFNQTDAIEAELDIFVPSLRLAFELNGIFHYEPIYGTKKFASVLKNDQRKMLACAEQGIELCVIDTSHEKYFKPVKAQKFLDIVANLIRTKLSGDSPVLLPLPSQNHVEVPFTLT